MICFRRPGPFAFRRLLTILILPLPLLLSLFVAAPDGWAQPPEGYHPGFSDTAARGMSFVTDTAPGGDGVSSAFDLLPILRTVPTGADVGAPVLRGDWVPPDLLVLAYEEEWWPALDRIMAAAMDEAEILVLAGEEEVRGAGFWPWTRRYGADVVVTELNSPWIRDYGPVQVMDVGDRVSWVDPRYATDRPSDDLVPNELGSRLGIPVTRRDFYLEGGGLVSNGRGFCVMTDRTLVESEVDPTDQQAVDGFLRALGCHLLAVIPAPEDEETGHADMFVQFVAADVAVVASAEGPGQRANTETLDMGALVIAAAANLLGQPLQVVRVPMPVDGTTFYSYINGTRVGDRFLVPHYNAVEPSIQYAAYHRLREAMPGVELVPIPSDAVIASGGVVHCLTLGLSLPRVTRLARQQRFRARSGLRMPKMLLRQHRS